MMRVPTTWLPWRIQAYRLAWLAAVLVFAVVELMWIMGHDANQVLTDFGSGLVIAAGVLSVAARRLSPFIWALLGGFLLAGTMCA